MRDKAKAALEELKTIDKDFLDKFNSYVALLKEELEIPEEIAVTLVTDKLIKINEKKLILYSLFGKDALEIMRKM